MKVMFSMWTFAALGLASDQEEDENFMLQVGAKSVLHTDEAFTDDRPKYKHPVVDLASILTTPRRRIPFDEYNAKTASYSMGPYSAKPRLNGANSEPEPTCTTGLFQVTSVDSCEQAGGARWRGSRHLPNYPFGCSDRIDSVHEGVWFNTAGGNWEDHGGFTGKVALVCSDVAGPLRTPPKAQSCDGKVCELEIFDPAHVDTVLEVASNANVPASLRGLWFMDGNPLADEVISLATTFEDVGHGTVVGNLPLDASNLIAQHDDEDGARLSQSGLATQLFYEFRCTFSGGNRDNVTSCQISPSAFGSPPIPAREPIFNWTMDMLSKDDDRHIMEDGENADEQLSFVRDSFIFGLQGSYILRRIVDQNGQRLQNNWNHYINKMQQADRRKLATLHNTQVVSEPHPLQPQFRMIGKALLAIAFPAETESVPSNSSLGFEIHEDLQYETVINRPGRCDDQTLVGGLKRAMELGVAMAISAGHETPMLGGLAAVLDHLIGVFTVEVWGMAYENGGSQPINPATDPFINRDSPLPYPANALLFTWAELLAILNGLVRLPLVQSPFHTDGNFTYYFLQKAEQNCGKIQPFASGPMIFNYDEAVAVLEDPTQKRGFYVATTKQHQQSFNLDSPLFLDSGSEQHNQFREILEITQFADAKVLDNTILAHLGGSAKPGAAIVDGMVSEQVIVQATFPAIMKALWGEFPGAETRAVAGYLSVGGIGVFGEIAHDLIMGVRMTPGEPSLTELLLNIRKTALQFAKGSPYGQRLKKSAEVQSYTSQFPGLFSSKPWNKALGYNTEIDHFIMNVQDAAMFAGLIGTSQLAARCVKYQHNDTAMKGLFEDDPERFIIESMRYEAAVRSVTALYKKDTDEVILGKNISFQADTPYQVVMASANRDPAVFQDPNKFNPSRSELGDMLSWNGRLKDVEAGNRTAAPRLCPGHCLSLKLGALVCASFMGSLQTLLESGKLSLGSDCTKFQ